MNEAAFLSALHESPDDEVTWLALADWLEENDQPRRAELIRVVRRLRSLPLRSRSKNRAALEDRVIALIQNDAPVVPEIVNSVGMRLALLPAGRVRMGSTTGETMRGDDEVIHQVRIARPFYLGVFPVTQEEFRRVTRNSPSHYRRGGVNGSLVEGLDTSRFPVENVSWRVAVSFCERLSKRKEEIQAGRRYRLPTEQEWEYACRAAGTSLSPFAFGSSLHSTQANFDGNHPFGGEAEQGPALHRPCDVGSYLPNAFGLYDMHGNVWEWCQDVYEPYQIERERGRPAPPAGTGSRVVRGGAYYNYAAWCRSARRGSVGSTSHHGHIGFRIAADWPTDGTS